MDMEGGDVHVSEESKKAKPAILDKEDNIPESGQTYVYDLGGGSQQEDLSTPTSNQDDKAGQTHAEQGKKGCQRKWMRMNSLLTYQARGVMMMTQYPRSSTPPVPRTTWMGSGEMFEKINGLLASL